MKANLKNIQEIFTSIPKRYEVNGQVTDNYNLLTELHYADGWRDVVNEDLGENQKHATENVIENDKVVKKAIDLTAQEIEAKKDNAIREFMQTKKSDGLEYSENMRFQITKELIGKPIAMVNEIDNQTKDSVMPLLELIENGDYWTAMNKSFIIVAPTNEIALKYFNELKSYIINYVQTNYPKE